MLGISQFSCDEAIGLLGVEPERVTNILGAADEIFVQEESGRFQRDQLLARHGIDRPFVMYAGGFDSRKNIAALVRAFAMLPYGLREAHQLVIVGQAPASERLALETVREKIDYINPHATSTPIGDLKEIEAIRAVFGDACPPISATKSLTGHSLGATGVQESIYCILMLQHRFLCESANIDELDPAFADMPILRSRRDDVDIGIALSNSFGFGGTNATLVFRHPDLI